MKFGARKIILRFGFTLSIYLAGHGLLADIKLPALFSDNMVLQQKERVALWGWAGPGEWVKVTAGWHNKAVSTRADAGGNWQVRIQTPGAGGPYTLTFEGNNTVRVRNVMLGEVWICSGQSNMHFPVAPIANTTWATGVLDYKNEVRAADYPGIRMFTVGRKVAGEPLKDVEGRWEVCSPATVGSSAVAFFFAREITRKTRLPIGLINTSWGGTPAESWTKKEVLASDEKFRPILKRYKAALADYPQAFKEYKKELARWQQAAAAAKTNGEKPQGAPREPIGPDHHKSPYKIYNAMIAPLVGYSIRGAIWYQGESNAERAYQYRFLLPAMIKSWRKEWNKQFPFYFVQIAPHRSQGPEIREAQLMTWHAVPKTGMVVTTDWGDSLDIHPRNKQIIGHRLALWALAKDYGQKDMVYSGPVYRSMHVEGNRIRLEFDYAEQGLQAQGPLTAFTIAGAGFIFLPAKAVIAGNAVLVWHDSIKDPVAVRFAWKNIPEPHLYNKAGLPASPFRTDRQKGRTYKKY